MIGLLHLRTTHISDRVTIALCCLMIVLMAAFLSFGDIASLIVLFVAYVACLLIAILPSRIVSTGLIALLTLTCLLTVIGSLIGSPPLRMAWLGNINLVGYMASILLLIALKRQSWTLIVLAGAALIAVGSTGAIVTSLACIAYLYRANRLMLALCAVGILASLLANTASSYIWRLVMWRQVIVNEPIAPHFRHAHNALMQSLYAYGLFGLSLACVVAFCLAWGFIRVPEIRINAIWILISSTVDWLYWWPGILAVVIVWTLLNLAPDHLCEVRA